MIGMKNFGILYPINLTKMVIIGYIASVCIGISLGLIGGGGSILTIPVLVYLFHIEPVLASAYSLFVVGVTSLTGAIRKYRQKSVDLSIIPFFGIPSVLAVFLTRKYFLPAMPEHLFTIGGWAVSKPTFVMLLFSVLMILASISMIRGQKEEECIDCEPEKLSLYRYILIGISGLLEGLISGLVGAGGGFLIIPSLVLFGKLPMKRAIGTSLLIVGIKSLIGFTGDLSHTEMDWELIRNISILSLLGFYVGNYFSRKISSAGLKTTFGYFVLLMGIYIMLKEFVFIS